MKVTLIRHTSVAVESGIFYGASDVGLNASFPSEAEVVAVKISGEAFDAVYCSPLSRCRKLATFCGYSDPIIDNRLKELNFGDWEMKRWEDIKDPLLEVWYKDWVNVRTPNGESFHDQYERVTAFLKELKNRSDQEVCIFAHGGVLRCAQIYAGEYEFSQAFVVDLPYGSVITIEI